MRDFRNLEVWQRGHKLVLAIYQATAAFPGAELYGLTSQMRRAAVSVPANIAEGCGLGSPAELKRYMQIAMGSASEREYHLLLAHDLKYLYDGQFEVLTTQLVELRRMLNRFLQTLSRPDRGA